MNVKGLHETKLYVNECTSRTVCRNFAKGYKLGAFKKEGGGGGSCKGALEDNLKNYLGNFKGGGETPHPRPP